MSDAQVRNALKVLAVALLVVQTVLVQAVANFAGDLGMTRAQVAACSLLANGLGVVLLYLPPPTKGGGEARGSGRR